MQQWNRSCGKAGAGHCFNMNGLVLQNAGQRYVDTVLCGLHGQLAETPCAYVVLSAGFPIA